MVAFQFPNSLVAHRKLVKGNAALSHSFAFRRVSTCSQDVSDAESYAMAAAGSTLILKHAAKAYLEGGRKPSPVVVREAILQLEKVQKRNKIKSDVAKLYGQWRLIFTGDKTIQNPVTRALFFPIRAHQTFNRKDDDDDDAHKDGEFDNAVIIIPSFLFFRIVGPMRWVSKANRMEFSVDRLVLKIGPFEWIKNGLDKEGYSLEGRTAKTLPFFTFFSIRDDILVARGRSGGIALYYRVPDDEAL